MVLTSLIDPRANNFNVLRLVAASAVVFSHATDITRGEPDALEGWIGYSGGWIAVTAFFCISGMLIYRSIAKRGNVLDYIAARCLRIFPGLWVMLVLTTVVLGLFFSTVSVVSFFTSPQVYEYDAGNAIMYVPRYLLPGVFESNPTAGVVNGSLWTLRFEFTCYIGVLVLFLLKAYSRERNFLVMLGAYLTGYVGFLALAAARGDLDQVLHDGSDLAKLHRLSLAFVIGMVMGRYVDRFRLRGWMVALCGVAAWATFGTPLFVTALTFLIAALVFWIAFLQAAWLVPFRRMHDYSYGIYIYAFPVQQCVAQLAPGWGPLPNALVSYALTVPLAALSWHLVESPALDLKARLSRRRVPA